MYSFQFAGYFTALSQSEIDQAYLDVSVTFYGVSTMWGVLPADIQQKKRDLCFQYLVAWYLADIYPSRVVNIQAMGGIPIKFKTIDGVQISYDDMTSKLQGQMKQLTTNVFGYKALMMITSAPEMYGIYG
jgi:hypothetical protein